MYRVILEFKKSVSFELEVEALNKDDAKRKAESTALQCGWNEKPKKSIVIKMEV